MHVFVLAAFASASNIGSWDSLKSAVLVLPTNETATFTLSVDFDMGKFGNRSTAIVPAQSSITIFGNGVALAANYQGSLFLIEAAMLVLKISPLPVPSTTLAQVLTVG
jgi:hypothetical protein